MTVRDLVFELMTYNGDAKVTVVAHNKTYPFRLEFSGAEGGKKADAISVHVCVPELNGMEETVGK